MVLEYALHAEASPDKMKGPVLSQDEAFVKYIFLRTYGRLARFALAFAFILPSRFEFEFELVFILGGSIFVAFAGMVGRTLASESVTYPVLVLAPRRFALMVVLVLSVVLQPAKKLTATKKVIDKNLIDPPVFFKV
jgi:hypothetical protein